jgi:hypothetical protein
VRPLPPPIQGETWLKIDFREIFGAVRFSTFATLSGEQRTSHFKLVKSDLPFSVRAYVFRFANSDIMKKF